MLTGFGEILKESAEKKLEQGNSSKTPTCDNGKTAEWYEDMALPIPRELEERLDKQDGVIQLEDEDFEEIYTEIMVYSEDIKLAVTDRGLTTVFLKDDLTITVIETAEEIDDYLSYLEMNWFDRLRVDFSLFIRGIKLKLGLIKIKEEELG